MLCFLNIKELYPPVREDSLSDVTFELFTCILLVRVLLLEINTLSF